MAAERNNIPITNRPLDAASETELLLQASEQLLRHSREKIFIKDKNLIYRGVSSRFAAMAGWEQASDLVGKTDFEIFEDQELAQRYREDDKKLIAQQRDLVDYVEPITEKDGRPRYASTSKFILRDGNGSFIGLVGVSRDITMEYYLQRNRIRALEYLFSLPQDVFFAAYLDLDDWRIVSEQHQQVEGEFFPYHNQISTLIFNAYERITDPHWPAYAFYRDFSRSSLQALHQSGKTEFAMEYQRLTGSGVLHWVRDEICFVEDIISGHLCMMLVVRDIQQHKSEEEARIRQSELDELTGLLNRKATMQLIQKRLTSSRPEEQHALVMLDADYFKLVNDTYGHQAGDQVLAVLGQAICQFFSPDDLVGRIGGDEFFIFMPGIRSREAIEGKLQGLLERLRTISYGTVNLSASIGVGIFPSDANTLEGLYAIADQAMYSVKDNGRNGICFAADLPKQANES